MEKKIKSQDKKVYISPDIEIMDIVTEQNILANGSVDSQDLPGMGGENW